MMRLAPRILLFSCLLVLPVAAQRGKQPDFTGRWSTGFGPMTLEQRGDAVTGTFGFEDESTVDGEVDGRTLAFSWRNARGRGKGELKLSDDGELVIGSYERGDQEPFLGGFRLVPHVPKLVGGQIVTGQTESGMRFHARAPKRWNRRDDLPALVILHGSNMTAADYVATIAGAFPKLAERYLVIGFDGEHLSPSARPEALAFNYTYINFSGEGVGPIWMQRQSPGLLADGMRQLQEEWDIPRFVVGGHSQGGFLTWVMALHFPELVSGAFPMSCNLLVQCEPDYFDDAEHIAAQHRVALAPIHGENDKVVDYGGSTYAVGRMIDGGFPAVRLFSDPRAAHMFARLPVLEAVNWIELMTADDPDDLIAFAKDALDAGDDRDAVAALARARSVDGSLRGSAKRRADAVDDELVERIEAAAVDLLPKIRADEDGGWVEDFLAFRRRFGPHPAAAPVMEAYAKVRAAQADEAEELFGKARGIRDRDERNAVYRELLERCYASKWYEPVKGWLD